MNATGVEVSDHVGRSRVCILSGMDTHTGVVCAWTRVSRHGGGRLACVMVSVAVGGPVHVWVALRAWVWCGGLENTPVRGVRRAGSPTCGGCSAP